MPLETYQTIYDRACQRKGGEQALLSLLKKEPDNKQLKKLGEDRFLSAFTKKVFQSGFVWRVVEQKWPAFEEAFYHFKIDAILMQPDEYFEQLANDASIIRNYRKIVTVKENALMIRDVRVREGSFAEFVADWPSTDIIGLWQYLKKHGSRLGGNTGPYALRALGKDTFLLSRDVEHYLRINEVFTGSPTSKRSLQQIQAFFDALQQASGRSYQHLSQVISMSTGENVVFP